MNCENCANPHDGGFGSGRFCSKSCSRSFSTKRSRKEINSKVSQKLKGRKLTVEHRAELKRVWKPRRFAGQNMISANEIFVENSKFSSYYAKQRLLGEIRPYLCEECGLDSWNQKPITLQMHHKNGVKDDLRLENLEILCPNCHSQTDNYAGKGRPHSSVGSERSATNREVGGSNPSVGSSFMEIEDE